MEVIAEADRKGRPRDLFWPWCAANVSILAVSWGSYVLGFGLSFWQGIGIAVFGTILSFLLVGASALSGQKGSAPTLVLSRAAFGVRGNIVGGLVSYLLLVGWEVSLTSMSVLATRTVLGRLGVHSGFLDVVVFLVVASAIVGLAVLGFDAIMRAQKWLTILTLVMTVVFMVVTWGQVSWHALMAHPAGSPTAVIGAFVMVLAGFGIGWVNCAGDYSRYLPRSASAGGVTFWTTFGGALPVVLLIGYGLLLCGSNAQVAQDAGADPVGALTSVLPTWFLVPFWIVAVLGLIAGAIIDIYSSGLTLLAIGLPVPRWAAALLDGVLMVLGSIYVVWFAPDFLTPFQSFLISMGVLLAAWAGIFLADMLMRWHTGYDEARLFDASPAGYGSVNWVSLALLALGGFLGLGLVVGANDMHWLAWEGYLLGPLGLGGRTGAWAFSNIGMLVALGFTFVAYIAWWQLTGQGRRHQGAGTDATGVREPAQ